MVGISVAAIGASIFLATGPQRELARRELERQDALIEHQRESLEALSRDRAQRANEFIENAQADQHR
jgi:hypothetical protein